MTLPPSPDRQPSERERSALPADHQVRVGQERVSRSRFGSTSRRIWWFRMLSVSLAVLPFLAAEYYLRFRPLRSSGTELEASLLQDPLFDIRQTPPLFVKSDDGQSWRIPEERYNFFRPVSFPVEKADATRRVFVLGGSTVQGRPYETETSMSAWIQLRLESIDPRNQYEIINCGGVSYASYRLAIILKQLLELQPDAIVLYTGHNEFLEERSYATMEQTIFSRLANRSKLVSAVRSLVLPGTRTSLPSKVDLSAEVQTRLDLENGLQRYQRASQDAQWRDAVVTHFGDRLEWMVSACKQANTPLLLCMPASDLVNTPPFKVSTADLSQGRLVSFEKFWMQASDASLSPSERMHACQSCLEIDPEHAGACYIAGMLAWGNGNAAKARSFLLRARDTDVCPLRATTPLLNEIKRVADVHSINLIRCDRLLDEGTCGGVRFSDGIPDPIRFVDHVHPTIKGHQMIGQEIARRLVEVLGIKAAESNATQRETSYESAVKRHLMSLGEDYHMRAKQRLEGLQNWAAGRAGRLKLDVSVATPGER